MLMTESRIVIDGMTCTHCEHAIHDALTPLVGVIGIRANASDGAAIVEHDGPLNIDEIAAAVTVRV
ncbi:heavy-metal-associated domain-containing protein [Microbacterium sp. NPDC078428]|uniref:heavy-metal-associated domain-containing protein n=1 Tax=Microbacterium sp. NPDC078428 TaxID=3364190 RepID=UPI0037CC9D15